MYMEDKGRYTLIFPAGTAPMSMHRKINNDISCNTLVATTQSDIKTVYLPGVRVSEDMNCVIFNKTVYTWAH